MHEEEKFAADGRFTGYPEKLGMVVGHADWRERLRAYVTGILLSGERRSIEPKAARIAPRLVQARHQSMHHFVASAPRDEAKLLRVARDYALAQLEHHGPVAA